MDELTRGTKEFVKIRMLADVDLSAGSVQIGLGLPGGSPAWQGATWIGLPVSTPDGYVHKFRTTAVWDTTSIAAGYWEVWGRVTDSPEDIIRPAGMLRVV